MTRTMRALTLANALGCGAMGGVFFAFSAFVMPALGRLPASQAVSAMQSINVTAVRPALMTALFGTAVLSAGLTVSAFRSWGEPRSALLLAGGALYLVGTVGLTIGYHVPLNNALARLDPASAVAATQWISYLSRWTAWNSVRAAAALAASAAYILARGSSR